jgi:hypothetical protein
VRGFVRCLQTHSRRRKQCTHQEDGHRRALEDAPQHGISLPRILIFCVIYITQKIECISGPLFNTALANVRLAITKEMYVSINTQKGAELPRPERTECNALEANSERSADGARRAYLQRVVVDR